MTAHLDRIARRTPTVAESAATIRQLIDEHRDMYVFRALIQIANDLADAEPALRALLADAPPAPTGHRGVDAFLAAIVEYRLAVEDLPCPAWVGDPERVVSPDWVPSGQAELAKLTREGTPEAFLRRGVLIHESDLVSY